LVNETDRVFAIMETVVMDASGTSSDDIFQKK
jgi:hypothetical protein